MCRCRCRGRIQLWQFHGICFSLANVGGGRWNPLIVIPQLQFLFMTIYHLPFCFFPSHENSFFIIIISKSFTITLILLLLSFFFGNFTFTVIQRIYSSMNNVVFFYICKDIIQ